MGKSVIPDAEAFDTIHEMKYWRADHRRAHGGVEGIGKCNTGISPGSAGDDDDQSARVKIQSRIWQTASLDMGHSPENERKEHRGSMKDPREPQ